MSTVKECVLPTLSWTTHLNQETQPNTPTKAENDDIVITIRLLVKGNKVGTIIGKESFLLKKTSQYIYTCVLQVYKKLKQGGDRISAMRKDSGCQIKIQGNDQHIEQIVTISGSLAGVVKGSGNWLVLCPWTQL